MALTSLPKTAFSGLDFSNIVEDITNLIIDNPDYNTHWSDFLSSNSGRMLTEIFAYIGDQLATRIDWIVNENFIGTATQKSAIMRLLKLIGYSFELPHVAVVTVATTLDRPIGTFYLTDPYDAAVGTLSPYTLTASDKSGNTTTFELLAFDSLNNKFFYKDGVEIVSGSISDPHLSHTLVFYEGTTKIETFTAETTNNPVFTLSSSPVTADSIQVFLIEESGGSITEIQLQEVNSFLAPDAQNEVDDFGNDLELPYILNVLDNDIVTIEFGSTALLPNENRRLRENDRIKVFYRTGGGSDGNITAQSISVTKTVLATVGASVETVSITYLNTTEAVEGENGETTEHAVAYAPLQIRTAQKAVTEGDYNIIMAADNSVLKSKAYGNNNFPLDLYTQYGEYIKPLDVWNFILLKKPGWETLDPSVYDVFRWATLRLENRFNEIHAFRAGDIDYSITKTNSQINYTSEPSNIDWDGNGADTFKNYFYLTMPSDWTDKFIVSGTPNTDLVMQVADQAIGIAYYTDVGKYNIFDVDLEKNNSGEVKGAATAVWQLKQDINAYLLSDTDISAFVNMGTNKYMTIGFDNIGDEVDIDLTWNYTASLSGVADANNVTAAEIAANINTYFLEDATYNNSTAGVTGKQEFGLTVTLTNPSGLADTTSYTIYVNGNEYTLITVDASSTYNQLITYLNTAFEFSITGDITLGSAVINNVNIDRDIYKIYKGMLISGAGIQGSSVVVSVDVENLTITMDKTATASTAGLSIIIQQFEATATGGNDIKIENLKEDPMEYVRIEAGITGNNLFATLTGAPSSVPVPTTCPPVHGYQDINLGTSTAAGDKHNLTTDTYYFKVNGYEYGVGATTGQSYNDLVTSLDALNYFKDNYDASFEVDIDSGIDGIRIKSRAGGSVLLESGTSSPDLLDVANLTDYVGLLTPVGGGDYSNVATEIIIGTAKYVKLTSPNVGKDLSIIKISEPGSLDITDKVFGINFTLTWTEVSCYGYKAITIITNDALTTTYSDIIYEHGSIYLGNNNTLYINYLTTNTDSVFLGKYNYDNYAATDPAWREKADRIYNTVYDASITTNTAKIDFENSDLLIKFTNVATDEKSIYAIANDWALTQSIAPSITTITLTDPITTLGASDFRIAINIDDKGMVQFDITGNSGGSLDYDLSLLTSNINTAIQGAGGAYSTAPYDTYDYAIIDPTDNNKIIIRSPSNHNASKVEFTLPAAGDDCSNQLFGSGFESTYPNTYLPSGDYFLDFDETEDLLEFHRLTGGSGTSLVPDLNVFIHFIFDKRIEDDIYDGISPNPGFLLGSLDEDVLDSDLEDKKVVAVNNVFKKPNLTTFDLAGTVYYDRIYSATDIETRVTAALQSEYYITNRDFAEVITRSKIMSIVHDVDGISYVEVNFLGKNYLNSATNVTNTIACDFDEVLMISEDIFVGSTQIHGVVFEYVLSEV